MPDDLHRLGGEIADLKRRLDLLTRSSRLSHSSIENGAVQVYDDAGSLRAVIGQQADGTSGVNVVNGPPPPQPAPPAVTGTLGGISISWDGRFTEGQPVPLDWARLEIHAAVVPDFTPGPDTLRATLESPQGGSAVVITDTPQYVRLVARNTSGTASAPSTTVGPTGRLPVVAEDVMAGIVDELALAEGAVTRAKVAVGAIDSDRLAIGTGNLLPDPSFEGAFTDQLLVGSTNWSTAASGRNSARCLKVDATAPTPTTRAQMLTTLPASPGDRFYLAVDYATSTDWQGTPRFYLRWLDTAGATLGYGLLEAPAAASTTWTRPTAQVQAPANTVHAAVYCEAYAASAGSVLFDNAEVRTVITAGLVLAGSIGTPELAADSVNAEKIVAQSITGREIKFKTLTGDHLDVNSARLALLTAGVITADMLNVDALNGKTIKGVHIIGVQIDGAVLRTGDAGSRVEITQIPATDTQPTTGQVRLLSGAATETAPAALYAAYDPATNTSKLRLQSAELRAPTPPAGGAMPRLGGPMAYPGASLSMWSEPAKGRMELSATEISSSAESTLFGSALYDRIEIVSGGSINARSHDGSRAEVYFQNSFYIGTDGRIGLYNQGWKTPSLGFNWAQYGGGFDKVAYRVYPDNTVGLRGILKRTARSTPAVGEELFTLPDEAVPGNTLVQQWTLVVLPTGALGTASAMVSANLTPATGKVTLSNISSAASTQLASGNGYVTWNVRYPLD
ncbi:hypothetical protein ABR738_00210 [Streptomyces sp. Edi4]|uniref:hypothetical protein n=1 Tax=Streptomyces sp. Edi4 TaxID=3162527 RepID=UPI0033056923